MIFWMGLALTSILIAVYLLNPSIVQFSNHKITDMILASSPPKPISGKVVVVDIDQESLVKYEGDSAWVEVETGPQTFEKRIIKTGLSDGVSVEVLEGVTKADKIKIQNPTVTETK